jgi:YVTN family beta-propeller protein
MAVSPDGARLYVTNFGSGTVSVVDAATNTVTETITVGAVPVAVAMSADGSYVFVTSATGNFTAIDVTTNTVTDSIAVGGNSIGLTVSTDGGRAYVTSTTSFPNGAVSMIAMTLAAVSV